MKAYTSSEGKLMHIFNFANTMRKAGLNNVVKREISATVIFLILFSDIRLCLSSNLFPSGFPISIPYACDYIYKQHIYLKYNENTVRATRGKKVPLRCTECRIIVNILEL